MNCNCIANIEKKLFDTLIEDAKFKKPIKKVRMQGIAFCFGKEVTTRTLNAIEIELDGQKKKVTMNMFHSFCPFCGVKQGEKS